MCLLFFWGVMFIYVDNTFNGPKVYHKKDTEHLNLGRGCLFKKKEIEGGSRGLIQVFFFL